MCVCDQFAVNLVLSAADLEVKYRAFAIFYAKKVAVKTKDPSIILFLTALLWCIFDANTHFSIRNVAIKRT